MSTFWLGFEKRAAESFVSANNTSGYPGAPEKMLKWNDNGGVDPRQPEELQAAQAARLVTLPPDVEGAKCGTCIHFRPITQELGHGFCTNPEIKMDVTDHMHCVNWTHPGVHDPAEAAAQEQQDAQFQQAMTAQQGGMMGGDPAAAQDPSMQQGAGVDTAADMGQPQQPAGQSMSLQPQTEPEAQTTEGDTGHVYEPSTAGSQSGSAEGQPSGNPLVDQAMQDFQGASTGGSEPAAPKKKKTTEGKKSSGGKGHTININVNGEKAEKTASVNFWRGIVEGY